MPDLQTLTARLGHPTQAAIQNCALNLSLFGLYSCLASAQSENASVRGLGRTSFLQRRSHAKSPNELTIKFALTRKPEDHTQTHPGSSCWMCPRGINLTTSKICSTTQRRSTSTMSTNSLRPWPILVLLHAAFRNTLWQIHFDFSWICGVKKHNFSDVFRDWLQDAFMRKKHHNFNDPLHDVLDGHIDDLRRPALPYPLQQSWICGKEGASGPADGEFNSAGPRTA